MRFFGLGESFCAAVFLPFSGSLFIQARRKASAVARLLPRALTPPQIGARMREPFIAFRACFNITEHNICLAPVNTLIGIWL